MLYVVLLRLAKRLEHSWKALVHDGVRHLYWPQLIVF